MSSERRLHPFSILFAFITQIRLFILPGILVYFGVGSPSRWEPRVPFADNDWWAPWMMLFVIPAALFAMLRYFTYRYSYEASELVIRSGLIFRKERHIPYARIQNIDAVQNVLHRLLNVVEIKIETGGGQSAEATMSVLPLHALQEMRERVFAERHAVAVHAGNPPEPAARPLLQLDWRELLLCGFIENRGAVLIAAGFGFAWEMGLADQFFGRIFGEPSSGRGVIRNIGRSILSNATVSWERIALTIAAFIGVLLLIRVFSMAWALVRLYGFTLRLVDDDARTEFGLLTRVAMTIPLRRIQALTVRESPLHRVFERVAAKVDTAGGPVGEEHTQSEREYLAPILRAAALPEFVETIVGIRLRNIEWRPVHPRAFRREVKGWLFPAFLMCAGLVFFLRWYALLLIPFPFVWAVIGARQTVKHLGWAVTPEAVLFKRGWLWRRTTVVRFAKVQTVSCYEGPFDRRNGMARVYVDVAGASEGSRVNIPYLGRREADDLFAHLSRQAALHQFRW